MDASSQLCSIFQSLLISTFKHSNKLSRLVLSLCNDIILRAISVHCRSRNKSFIKIHLLLLLLLLFVVVASTTEVMIEQNDIV